MPQMREGSSVINVEPDVRYKVDVWKQALERRYDRPVTYSEVIDYISDMAGVPEEMQ